MGALETLKRKDMVSGLKIDDTSMPLATCTACVQAKQAHRPFPKEAENRSKVAGERIVSDVWGPARVQSIGGWHYYISFMDDAT